MRGEEGTGMGKAVLLIGSVLIQWKEGGTKREQTVTLRTVNLTVHTRNR